MSRLEEQEKVIKASVLSEEEKKCLLNSIRNERRKILICSDQVEDKNITQDLKEEFEKVELLMMLEKAIQLLEKIEIKIINSLYFENKTLSMISKELGVSTRTIRRKENEILLKLRKILIDFGGPDYEFRIGV